MSFNIRDGIGDDISRVSESVALRRPVAVSDVLWTLGAATAAAYIGIHALRAVGARTDLGDAVGAVVGIMALDASVKYIGQGEA